MSLLSSAEASSAAHRTISTSCRPSPRMRRAVVESPIAPSTLPLLLSNRCRHAAEVLRELLEVRGHPYHPNLVQVGVQLGGPDDGPRRESLEPVLVYVALHVLGSAPRQQHLPQGERVRGAVKSLHHPDGRAPRRNLDLRDRHLATREHRGVGVPLSPPRQLLDDRLYLGVEVAVSDPRLAGRPLGRVL